MDYDIYLEKQNHDIEEDKSLVIFIDSYLPFHPDFKMLNDNNYPVTPGNYYPKIRAFFEYLERNFRVHIIVAAHPRSEYEKLPDFFGGRKCIKGQTDELIRKSAIVISHDSTAINFAVLYYKPIIFISTNEFSQKNGVWPGDMLLKSMATLLKRKYINLDTFHKIDLKDEMLVNTQAYSEYIDNYIKTPGTPEIPIWEIFSQYIIENYD